jgi:hypothetical protein
MLLAGVYSCFSFYCAVSRQDSLSTGLQIDAEYAILFWEHRVLKFGRPNRSASYHSLKGTDDLSVGYGC